MKILDILGTKNDTPDNGKETYTVRYLGWGIVTYQVEIREFDKIAEEWDWHYETRQERGAVIETPRYLKVVDSAGGALIIHHAAVDSMLLHDDAQSFESYMMHAELKSLEGDD